MSAYTKIEGVVFKDKDCLIEALKELLGEEKAEKLLVYDEPVNLYGYHHDKREQRAEIVLPGSGHPSKVNIVGPASNDIGFAKQADGTWLPLISDYDSIRHNKEWLGKLTALATEQKIRKNAKRLGMQVQKKINKEGKVVLSLIQA